MVLRTKITYNNGKTWQDLVPPTLDANGQRLCDYHPDKCTLNLFGATTWVQTDDEKTFGNFYSVKHAIGMIIGTGRVGSHLNEDENAEINTYFSRDGGLSWDEIIEGSTIYEYGDHGGLLVLAWNNVHTRLV